MATQEVGEGTVEPSTGDATADRPDLPVPPARRGDRETRREATLRAFSTGGTATCAYCGRDLPPIPPRGGRPSPYCPPDPDRYGRWGSKVITCALLDESREIWVHTYGPDQPMTHMDVQVLDQRAAGLLAALDPLREEIAALRSHAGEETAAALAARADADGARAWAEDSAREAEAERDRAVAAEAQAREEAEHDRTARQEAEEQAAEAVRERDAAVARQQKAEREKNRAVADRAGTLDQVGAAHERIAQLQTALATERAKALEKMDQLRREEQQAREELRAALDEEWEKKVAARTGDLEEQLRAQRDEADRRVTELNEQLTRATRDYAGSLQPLHDEISKLRSQLTEQTATAGTLRQRLDSLHTALHRATEGTADGSGDDGSLRQRVLAALQEHGAR